MFARITLLFLILSLSACVSKPDPSPVVERPLNRYSAGENRLAQDALGSKVYIVQSGDTLYSIALRHGLDVRQLAEINNISNPGELRIGQELYLQTSFPSNLAVQQEDPSSQPTLYSISQPEAVSVAGYQPDILEHEREISESVKVEPKGILLPYSDSARNQLSRHTEVAAVQQATAEKPSGDGSVQPISVNVNKGGINWGWPVEGLK